MRMSQGEKAVWAASYVTEYRFMALHREPDIASRAAAAVATEAVLALRGLPAMFDQDEDDDHMAMVFDMLGHDEPRNEPKTLMEVFAAEEKR